MRKYLLYIALLVFVFTSCDTKEDYEVEKSMVVEASGQWWVKYSDNSGYESDYIMLTTFNSASDDGTELWITDDGDWWDYKVKAGINAAALTFSGQDLVNAVEDYDIKIQVTNGKVILDGGKSTLGIVTDSIYFELEFEDDPGTIYQAAGIRRTGFLEDEH